MAESREKEKTGKHLQKLREQLGYTQEKFAEELEVSVSTIKKMEAGESNISIDTLRKLKVKFSDISADYLLFGERQGTNSIWGQLLNADEWERFIILQRLMAYFMIDDKIMANKEIDEDKMQRFIKYLSESFKDNT